MLDIANKCDIAETTVWKLENGRSVRWETVHLILVIGMRVSAGSDTYNDFQALWVKARQEMANNQPPDLGVKRMSKHAVAAVRKFRKIVHDLSEEKTKKVLAAAIRAANRSRQQPDEPPRQ